MRKKIIHSENQLLYLCGRNTLSSAEDARLQELCSQPLQWDSIVKLARRHELLPLVYYQLKKCDILTMLPIDIAQELSQAYYITLQRNSSLWNKITPIITAFEQEAIPLLFFKGSVFMETLYPNPGLRPMVDVDILIPADKLQESIKILRSCSCQGPSNEANSTSQDKYHTTYDFIYSFGPNDHINVELHTAIVPPRPHPISLPHIWNKTQKITVQGTSINTFSWENTLIILGLHLRRHTTTLTLKSCMDIAELIRQYGIHLDWVAIQRISRKNHCYSALCCALYLADTLLDSSPPAYVRGLFTLSPIKQRALRRCINRDNFLALHKKNGVFLRLLLFDSIIDLFTYVWKIILLEKFIFKKSR